MTKKDDTQASDTKDLQERLAKLTEIAARAQADLQNFKQRMSRDADELRKFAVQPLILRLLPIRDDLARASENSTDSESFTQILRKLDQILESIGLTQIVSMGEKVDPTKHESINTTPGEKDLITEVHEEGYDLHGRIVRPAKVSVGDGSE